MTILPLGDSAAVIVLGESIEPGLAARARALAGQIDRERPSWVVEVVAVFANVAVYLDPLHAPEFTVVHAELTRLAASAGNRAAGFKPRTVEIPVVYGGESGPDLAEVARHTGLSSADVIGRHAAADYEVHAVGFAPGFPYLGGLSAALAVARRATPRASVPAGSVGIGGAQTGVYPRESPGGWNLIGRTPLALFDPQRPEPALLRAGDRVKFRPIVEADFSGATRSAGARSDGAEMRGPAAVEILRPGVFTTVQDLGRPGHRAEGVPQSGAADSLALRVANLLVGNAEGEAVLEFTLTGPELKFLRDALVAIGGADVEGVPSGRPFVMRAGATLDLSRLHRGCRGYLAIAGGIDVPPVLGSRSTFVRGGFGGLAGRTLRAGDRLMVPMVQRQTGEHWQIDPRIGPELAPSATLRVVTGAQADEFGSEWMAHDFKVSPQSDRMGVRLTGAALQRSSPRELISAPVTPGTVQVPPDGQPIVLLADAQTIGGYPRLAHVITVDLARAAQLRPGDSVRFTPVSLDEARRLRHAQERALVLLRSGLAQKIH